MKTTATNSKLRKLLTGIKAETLIPRPDFQRRLVWSSKHKNSFIRTVLGGLPFPEIYIAAGNVNEATGEGTEILVDGQQRITTLFQYFIGAESLELEKDIIPYELLENKTSFLEYEVVVRDLGSMSISDIKEVFLKINSTNYSLNPMEINNARYDGAIKQFADSIAQSDFFSNNRVFSTNEIRRMSDTKFTLTVIVSIIETYFNRDSDLETFLDRYNDEFPQEPIVRKQLYDIFSMITNAQFDLKSRVWKKADLLTLIVEMHRALYKKKLNCNIPAFFGVLKEFYNEVDNFDYDNVINDGQKYIREMAEYKRNTSQSTNDRSSRISRGQIIYYILEGSVHVNG